MLKLGTMVFTNNKLDLYYNQKLNSIIFIDQLKKMKIVNIDELGNEKEFIEFKGGS